MKLYFFTHLLYPYQKTGGAQIRFGQINALKRWGWDITVVMPEFHPGDICAVDNIIKIPVKINKRIESLKTRFGFNEDYLDKWVDIAYAYLKNQIKEDDILFVTSGGELGNIKLCSLLTKKINCKLVINFHDPISYSLLNGRKIDKKFHVSREAAEKKYLSNADLIITSSVTYQKVLQQKYPQLKERIHNNYFGYIEQMALCGRKKEDDGIIRIAYAGNMWRAQKPEVLYHAFKRVKEKEKVRLYFIGNIAHNKTLQKIKASDASVVFIDQMPHREFLDFMVDHIDVGFVSLADAYFGACVPSKIYEYINLGLPMIGALPDGDAKEIINQNGYGIACDYHDIDGLAHAMEQFLDREFLESARQKVMADRDGWDMRVKIKELDGLLKELQCR